MYLFISLLFAELSFQLRSFYLFRNMRMRVRVGCTDRYVMKDGEV